MRTTGLLHGLYCAVVVLLVCCVGAASPGVKYWEDAITLPTYPWYDDVNPVFESFEDSIYYPYTRQDHIGKLSEPRTYRALCLENEYLRVTCIPELGGRIHSVVVKATGTEMFHRNDVIKPALIAMRGAWIGGGIEWNSGPHGHTVTILSPVDTVIRENRDRSVTLVVSNTEKMFRTCWTVELTLHPGKAYLDEAIRMYNPTDGIHPYYFWNCTGFPNMEGTRFIYPMTLGTDHNGTTFFRWPVNEGRDLSWLKNYDTMSSIFGYRCDFDFFGAYDVNRDQGIVSYANHHELPGKKAWTWGKDDFGVVSQMALSDAGPAGSQYIEVQSGPLLTQSDYGMLRPGREIRWQEYWYPVHGLGDGFEYATRHAALQTERKKNTMTLRILATEEHARARLLVEQNGKPLLDTRVALSPNAATVTKLDYVPAGPVQITLQDVNKRDLLHYQSPLAIPAVEPPDLTVKPAREDGQPTAGELYEKAFLLHSQTNHKAARGAYEEVLAVDPLHEDALCGLATLALETARWEEVQNYAEKALTRNENSGKAWYLLGVALLQQGNHEGAKQAGYKAARTLQEIGRGYQLAGRAEMRLGDFSGARHAFEQAVAAEPMDTRSYNSLLAAMLKEGSFHLQRNEAKKKAFECPTDYILCALIALEKKAPADFTAVIQQGFGEKFFTVQETACFLADLGLYAEAAVLLESALGTMGDDLMTHCYTAWCLSKADLRDEAAKHLQQAATMSPDYVMPSRPEEIAVLEHALSSQPDSAAFHLLYGHVLGALKRMEEAVTQWNKAVELDASLSVGWRLLAMNEWKAKGDAEAALPLLDKAIAARPDDQILYRDKAVLLEKTGNRAAGIALIEAMPRKRVVRYDIHLWLAQAYVDEKRYDDCIEMLSEVRFSNWEASTKPHDIFVSALLARGRIAFEEERYQDALGDFERALTFPENLEVGARYELTDAETRYWLGRVYQTLGDMNKARDSWTTGSKQRTSTDPPMPFISISKAQDEYVQKCHEALAGL